MMKEFNLSVDLIQKGLDKILDNQPLTAERGIRTLA